MKRFVVFSHFDSENLIKDYVIYYLSELKKYAEKIIFVSDCDVLEKEMYKIKDYVSCSIIGRHGEYDFGSYKRGYEYLLNNNLLKDCDELIFANDSCYAPLFPFEEMFQKMEQKELDFWGVTMNKSDFFEGIKHIQTYFIAFKPNVFASNVFKDFIFSISKQDKKENIILKYECELTNILSKTNFSWDVYCELSKHYQDTHILYFKELIKENRCPFLKRKIPALESEIGKMIFKIHKFIERTTNYNYFIIDNKYYKIINNGLIKYYVKKYVLLKRYTVK